MVHTIPPSKLRTFFLLIAAVILTIGAMVVYNMAKKTSAASSTVQCTMEAMLCPDGSYVGRVAPNCDFAECPTR